MRARRIIGSLSAPALAVLLAVSAPAHAQQRPCRAGYTASGACANAGLTASMQQRAIVFSQAQLSFLGPPLPYSLNGYADAVRDRQGQILGIQRPVPVQGMLPPAVAAPVAPGGFQPGRGDGG